MVSLLHEVRRNLSDVRHYGPLVLFRHFARLRHDRVARINVPHIGPVLVRSGDSDMRALRQVFSGKEYDLSSPDPIDRRIRGRYSEILAAGGKPIIVDAGANIGAASLSFAAQFPEAGIVAIEPDPANAALARRNLQGRSNCIVLEAAIGAERGFVELHSEGESWGVRTARASSGVPIVTIEDALSQSLDDTPFIVKIDIEGFEKDLFAANTGWIGQAYAVIIEPHDWMLPGEFTSRTFQQALSPHPFELVIRGENLFYVRA